MLRKLCVTCLLKYVRASFLGSGTCVAVQGLIRSVLYTQTCLCVIVQLLFSSK
jgi:hypothetical protein